MRLHLLQQGTQIVLNAGVLLMHESRVEPEARLGDAEFSFGLGDAAFAQDDRLLALAEGFADDGPFFEGVVQHKSSMLRAPSRKRQRYHCSLRNSRCMSALTASRALLSSCTTR